MTREEPVTVEAAGTALAGQLGIPSQAAGLVVFAHGSGSSRHSPRNQAVAEALREAHNLATLLFDLLTPAEDKVDQQTRALRFDIELLSGRVVGSIDWCASQKRLAALPIGCFGASTGAAAALRAAAQQPERVQAVVSRGGRPDLAGDALPKVQAPTLLIVGGRDTPVIDMNKDAQRQMRAENRLEIVPSATHLFEEPGALEEVARLTGEWFGAYLPG